ncbi:MAG: type VI protein secretion system component VasF, partial [bacterium]
MTNDPFAFDDDDDRTVLRPSSNQVRAATPHAPKMTAPANNNASLPPLGGINPLEKAASRLLPLLLTIRHSTDHPNPDQ